MHTLRRHNHLLPRRRRALGRMRLRLRVRRTDPL